jgi:hypothetical protein
MLSISEVEQFILDTFSLCFGGRSCTKFGHVRDQRNYILGCIETLHRRGDISEVIREFYCLKYYEGLSSEDATERIFGEMSPLPPCFSMPPSIATHLFCQSCSNRRKCPLFIPIIPSIEIPPIQLDGLVEAVEAISNDDFPDIPDVSDPNFPSPPISPILPPPFLE